MLHMLLCCFLHSNMSAVDWALIFLQLCLQYTHMYVHATMNSSHMLCSSTSGLLSLHLLEPLCIVSP